MAIQNNFYKGNASIRKSGTQVAYTQHQIDEYIKCENDPIYFIENYCQIVSLDRGLILFKMHEYQKNMVRLIHENRFSATLLGRQMGKTISVAAYLVHCAIFNQLSTTAILAHKASGAREVMSRIQNIYENLPSFLQHGLKSYNKGSIELENGSKIFTAATSANAITGRSCSIVYIDEAAVISNNLADEFFASAFPTLSSGKKTKMIMTSTPRGYNHYYHLFKKAEEGTNGFVTFKAHWTENPERDQKWADEQKSKLGEILYFQEIECSFIGSSNTLVNGNTISKMHISPYIYSRDNLDITEAPLPNHSYILIADTSRGVGGDYSAFTVIDVTEIPYRMVAKFRDNKIAPLLYPTVIYRVATDYNSALVLVEINDIGGQVADILYQEMEYENMLFISKEKGGQKLSSGFSTNQQTGIRTDKLVKRIGCSTLKSLVEENKFIITDPTAVAEFSTFTENKIGFFAADSGYHDDIVITLVLFAWITTQPYFKDLTNGDLRRTMYENQINNIESNLTPFGFRSDGIEDTTFTEVMDNQIWSLETAPERSYYETNPYGLNEWH